MSSADIAAMTDPEIAAALAIVRQSGGSLTPTIFNQRMRLSASDARRFPPPSATAQLPAFWRVAWGSLVGHPETPADIATQINGIAASHKIVRQARMLGIDVLAGTDTLMPDVNPGDGLLREIDELAQAYGDNEAALEAATRINGRHIANGMSVSSRPAPAQICSSCVPIRWRIWRPCTIGRS